MGLLRLEKDEEENALIEKGVGKGGIKENGDKNVVDIHMPKHKLRERTAMA